MEVFMDNFTVYADSFDACLENLSKVLTRCIDTNLVLNIEKELCWDIWYPTEASRLKNQRLTSSPLFQTLLLCSRHAGFYRRFIKNFSKVALPLSKLLQKDVDFKFDQPYVEAFQELKNRLASAPILQAPNSELPFDLMCDTSNSTLGAVLGQRDRVGKPMHVIAYMSRGPGPELLAIVFALEKFRSYLLGSKIIVFSDHVVLRFLLKKPDAKLRLIRWMLLLQELIIEIRDKKGSEKSVVHYLRQIERESDPIPIRDEFHQRHPGYTRRDFKAMPNISYGMILTFGDSTMIKCILDAKIKSVFQFCHATSRSGHYGSTRTTRKVLDCGFYWPTIFRHAYQFVSTNEKCQKSGMAIRRRHKIPQQPILFYKVFDVLGIDFMEPFLVSNGYSYILLAIDYVSRWVEAIATKTNDARVVMYFLKSNIFCWFGVSKALISDQGSHFCNRAMPSLLHKYGVVHRVATAYHP
ncbi:Retrovirus-related Pol polyprotein, partial [Mucuna pruriens]